MEIEPLVLVLSMVIGTIVGLGYFAGLWITVQILPKAKRPMLTWGASAILRVAGATVVFLILLRWGFAQAEGLEAYAPIAAGFAGFVIARFASTAIWGPAREPKMPTSGRRRSKPGDADREADQ